jgi:alcohol dehydrogenase class IV
MVTKDRFNQIAHTALGDASIVYNPEELRLDDILDILEKSY